MQRQNDLRVIRTHQMIKDAFLELMYTEGFSNITVDKLAKKAIISRNTFYLHYKDKFDLLDQLESKILDGLVDISRDFSPDDILNNVSDTHKMYAFFLNWYEYILIHSQFFKLIMSENGDPAFLSKLQDTIKSIIMSKNIINKLKIPSNYALAYVIGIQTSFINEWIRSGFKETPNEIVSIFILIIKDIPQNIIDKDIDK